MSQRLEQEASIASSKIAAPKGQTWYPGSRPNRFASFSNNRIGNGPVEPSPITAPTHLKDPSDELREELQRIYKGHSPWAPPAAWTPEDGTTRHIISEHAALARERGKS